MNQVEVFFVNNAGGGYADKVRVDAGTTVSDFVATQMHGQAPSNLLIRVNRESVESNYQLVNGDHVTCTPTKVAGA